MSTLARGPLVSDVTYFIELPDGGGNFQLMQVKTISFTDNSTGETIRGGAGPIGNTFARGGTTLSIATHRVAVVPEEVAWHKLNASKDEFTVSMQDGVGIALGSRYTWDGVQVTKVDREGADDANQIATIEAITARAVTVTEPAVA